MLTNDTTVEVQQNDTRIQVSNEHVNLEIHLENGAASCNDNRSCLVNHFRSSFRWQGREYSTEHYERHELKSKEAIVREGFGKGVHLVILHQSSKLPQLEQHFYVYESVPFVLVQSTIQSDKEIKVNRFAVVQSNRYHLTQEINRKSSAFCGFLMITTNGFDTRLLNLHWMSKATKLQSCSSRIAAGE